MSDNNEPKPSITVEEALKVLAEKVAGPPKTYEDGIAEAQKIQAEVDKLSADLQANNEKMSAVAAVAAKASELAQVHKGSHAGRALQQIVKDLKKVVGDGDAD